MINHNSVLKSSSESLHAASDEFPFAENYLTPGLHLKLLQADIEGGFFAVRIRFASGIQLPAHKHTGAVHAFTLAGAWSYLEYPESPANTAGSYLYEPPGSTHTLKVSDNAGQETDVIFVIYGAMLILDDSGTVVAVLDAENQASGWAKALAEQGKAVPPFIVGGSPGYHSNRYV